MCKQEMSSVKYSNNSPSLCRHDRPFIYNILNYARPGSAAKTVGFFTGLLVFCSCIQYGVYRLRVFLARKLGKLVDS